MTSLKDLIKLKPKTFGEREKKQEDSEDIEVVKITYFQSGFKDAVDSMGHPSSFTLCLRDLYYAFTQKCREGDAQQLKLKQPFIEEQNRVNTEIDRKETFVQIKEKEVLALKNKVSEIDGQIAEVKIDPNKFGIAADKRPKAQFYIGLVMLLPITLYLVVFYMSASYSAFFKEFSTDALTAAIFDAQAFSKASKDGLMEVIFVSTIPFAFMALGYLIHMFQKSKDTLKIIGLFIVTFIFDAILAYQIEKKLFDFNRTLNSADFNVQDALSSVGFWGIIFAGFVVYIIWGLVFDFIMKEYDNLDKVAQYIRKLKEDKLHAVTKIKETESSTNEVTQELSSLKGKVRELQATIDGFIFAKQQYLVLHAEYAKGWIKAILTEIALSKHEKDRLIKSCEEVDQEHLRSFRLGKGFSGNLIYTTTAIDTNHD